MRRILVASLVLAAAAATVRAESGDLKQTITDLTGQSEDKRRLDTTGAARLELEQLRGWLSDATNAVKEEKEKLCRQIFDRIRGQLGLIDQLISLGQAEAEAKKLEQALASAQKGLAAAKRKLDDRRVQLRALKLNSK